MHRLSSFARSLSVGGSSTNVSRPATPEIDHASGNSHTWKGTEISSSVNGDGGQEIPENKTIFQSFEWYLPGTTEHHHYTLLTSLLPQLSTLGISHIWLPPGTKATNPEDVGYATYDLWDLGEFDAKGTGHKNTKWGSKSDLERFCTEAKRHDVQVLWDAVLNHKAGADGNENARAVKVDPKDRTKTLTKPYEIESWTKFTFPARGKTYSDMKWDAKHFTGVDYDSRANDHGIFKFVGDRHVHGRRRDWASDVSKELGNYDYLMFADIDHSHPAVRADLFNWGQWITSHLNLGGMRLDAIKHYSLSFLADFLAHLDATSNNKKFFFVGEYWDSDSVVLEKILRKFHGRLNLFDVQLVYNFSDFSKGRREDLRTVFDGSLVQRDPVHAVTFVANHDTQETQSLAAPVEEWFIPLAYVLILLRADSGTPCVFWGDIFGNHGPRPRLPACGGKLSRLAVARKLFAYGQQRDYLDTEDCIGWTRLGHKSKSNGAGLAVIMTNSWDRRSKRMFVGQRHAGERWKDILGWEDREVVIDAGGFGTFPVGHRSVGVWTDEKAPGFDMVSRFTFPRMGRAVPPIRMLPL
ncbi:alpha-amylase [Exophiala viscosa]|uniref:Alpha-amylase n=1 Tax=Exophiala viscosa TaxID=2486360 RepID=A0AAN6IF35_9EURO|nr:alpha-amylase [Exophiala viscosa]